jgi:hypothetical protein
MTDNETRSQRTFCLRFGYRTFADFIDKKDWDHWIACMAVGITQAARSVAESSLRTLIGHPTHSHTTRVPE